MTIAIIEHTMHAMMRHRRSLRGAGSWRGAGQRVAARRGGGSGGDRGVSRQEVRRGSKDRMLPCRESQPMLSPISSYGGLRALTDVSLSVAEGQFVTVVGPNGAGKSTLFKTICGIVPPVQGGITFLGQNLLSHAGSGARASRHRACAGRPPGVQDPDRPREPGDGRLHQGRSRALAPHTRTHPHAVPDPGRTRHAACRHTVRRRTADAGDRPRPRLARRGC